MSSALRRRTKLERQPNGIKTTTTTTKTKTKLRKQTNLKKVSALGLRVAFCTEAVAIKEMSFSSRANVRLFCQIRWLDL